MKKKYKELVNKLMTLGGSVKVADSSAPPPSYNPFWKGRSGGVAGGVDSVEGEARGKDPAYRWRGFIRDSIVDGEFMTMGPSAFPVLTTLQGTHEWEALDIKIVKESRQAVTTYGVKSSYTQAIIAHIFLAYTLAPYDTKLIAQTLLTPHLQLWFFNRWESACQRVVYQPRQPGDPLFGVTIDALLGRGPFDDPQRQAQLPMAVLAASQEQVVKAWFALPDDKATLGFLSVKQGPTELYQQFIARLYDALNRHPDLSDDMKGNLLDIMAFDGANDQTKQILSTLPRGTCAAQLLETVERMGHKQKAAYMAEAFGTAVQPLV